MNYNTVQFYNAALAIMAGCSVAPLAFRLFPLPSPEVRASRLVALTLPDMRRLAVASLPSRLRDWEGLIYGRLAASFSESLDVVVYEAANSDPRARDSYQGTKRPPVRRPFSLAVVREKASGPRRASVASHVCAPEVIRRTSYLGSLFRKRISAAL
jgi:hypothetical protein